MTSITARLTSMASLIKASPHLQHVGLLSGLKCAMRNYRTERHNARAKMTVTSLNDKFDWVDVGGYGLAWPRRASLDHLATIMVELRVPTNPHFYFHHLTPIKQGDTVIDAGACEGAFAMEALIRYRATKVYAFEPSRMMAEALRYTAERNGVRERLLVVQAGLSARSGKMRFADSDNPLISGLDNSTMSYEVDVVSIDEYFGARDVDYIKIDIEGADYAALQGARTTIARCRPRLSLAAYHQESHANEMVEFIRSTQDYRTFVKGVTTIHGTTRPVLVHAYGVVV